MGAYCRRVRTGPVTCRLLAVAAAALFIVSLSGCTRANPVDPIVESASPSMSTPTSASPAIGDGSTSLSCLQGSDGTFAGVDNALDGHVQLDLLNTDARSTVPLARDVGLIVPSDRDWLFRKSPITVTAGTESVTVSVPDDGKQFLAMVPPSVWTNGTPPNLTQWSQTSITIQPCSDRAVSFLGGVLALASDQCFALHFQTESGLRDERQVRLDGQACDQ